jgi:IS1 family transposase
VGRKEAVMRKLDTEKRTAILTALVEGCSINATARMCGVSKLTVLRLLADVGSLCRDYHDVTIRRLRSKRVQLDEIWSFVGCKQKNKERGKIGDGDCWTWTALDADSKLVVSYLVGLRDAGHARDFVRDVASRIDGRIQLTSDGLRLYVEAVEDAFGGDVDYAQLVKIYGPENPGEARYSPPVCRGTETTMMSGDPDPDYVSTSYVERQNLTLRMHNRRFTRLTNAFSKRWINHEHAISLHYFFYNFCRIHKTLRITPAMAAGVTDHAWSVADLVALLEKEEATHTHGGRINKADRT